MHRRSDGNRYPLVMCWRAELMNSSGCRVQMDGYATDRLFVRCMSSSPLPVTAGSRTKKQQVHSIQSAAGVQSVAVSVQQFSSRLPCICPRTCGFPMNIPRSTDRRTCGTNKPAPQSRQGIITTLARPLLLTLFNESDFCIRPASHAVLYGTLCPRHCGHGSRMFA